MQTATMLFLNYPHSILTVKTLLLCTDLENHRNMVTFLERLMTENQLLPVEQAGYSVYINLEDASPKP